MSNPAKKAFIQISLDGDFPNENHYLAWRAFNYMDFECVKFKAHEFCSVGIGKDTPVFAGVDTFSRILKRLGVNLEAKELESYPKCLSQEIGRRIEVIPLGEIRKSINSGFFIKPLDSDRKAFDGRVVKESKDIDDLKHIPSNYYVVKSDPVEFLSEYRVFIHSNQILDSRKYKGDPFLNINKNVVSEAVLKMSLNCAPIAYSLDFGLTKDGRTLLVEATDAWSIGAYGLDMVHFGRILVDRWSQMVSV